MSYILDALKKAEAERDPDARANLAIAARERRNHRLLIYLVIAALIANVMLLAWILLPGGQDATSTAGFAAPTPQAPPTQVPLTQAPPTRTLPTQRAEDRQVPPPAPTNRPDQAAPTSLTGSATGSERTPATAALSPPAEPVAALAAVPTRLVDLPQAARRDFPALEFSTHIYADDPSLRAVVVNGIRLTEGDRLEGLVVREITEGGAILEYGRYLVEVPVLDSWN